MGNATEVRTELLLDDLASATLEKIKGGFNAVSGAVGSTAKSVFDFGKQVAAMAIGVNIGSALGMVKDVATSSARAAIEGQEQMRQLTAAVSGLSARKGDLQGYQDAAKGVYEQLANIAREAKVSRAELVQTFQGAAANTIKTKDQLLSLVTGVTKASRALSQPINEVVQGFLEIEKNTISANNPIISMVKQANLMRGHSEQIALRMQMMGKGGMIKMADKALQIMQERAKAMPATFKDIGHQIDDIKGDVLRTVGGPMANALFPVFEGLQERISKNRGEIERFARTMGVQAGRWITEAVGMAEKGFKYLNDHADEIRTSVKEGFQFAKDVFKFIIDNRKALAIGAGAAYAAPTAGAALGGMGSFAQTLAKINGTGLPQLGINASAAASGLAASAASLGAFTAALAAVGLATWQFGEYMKETGGYLNPIKGEMAKDMNAKIEAMESLAGSFRQWDDKTIKWWDEMRQKVVATAADLGQNSAEVGRRLDELYAQHRRIAESTKGFQDAASLLAGMPEDISKLTDQAFVDASAKQFEAAKKFAENFGAAVKGNNTAALNASVAILQGNKVMQQALLQAGSDAGLSLEKLAEVVGDKLGDFSKQLMDKAGVEKEAKATAEKGVVPLAVFNGGQTFNIKQDFRDADPDRIVTIFERDLVKSAESRLQARTALPFGP